MKSFLVGLQFLTRLRLDTQTEWKDAKDAFETQMAHELKVTSLINNLVDLSISEKEHATVNFLQWFVNEQVEEEESASGVLQKVKLAGESGSGIYMLDQELAQRIFKPPTASE